MVVHLQKGFFDKFTLATRIRQHFPLEIVCSNRRFHHLGYQNVPILLGWRYGYEKEFKDHLKKLEEISSSKSRHFGVLYQDQPSKN